MIIPTSFDYRLVTTRLSFHFSYGHVSVISGYKWDYTFYKWGYVSTYNW